MTGQDIKDFWETDTTKKHKYSHEKLFKHAAENIKMASEKFKGKEKLKYLEFYDAVNFLGSSIVFEDSKTLGRLYNINIYMPAAYKSIYYVVILYIIPYLRSLDPGFPYQVTLLFDEKQGLEEFQTLHTFVSELATEKENLQKIVLLLDSAEERTKRGAFLFEAK